MTTFEKKDILQFMIQIFICICVLSTLHNFSMSTSVYLGVLFLTYFPLDCSSLENFHITVEKEHNFYRRKHDAPPIVYDPKLDKVAEDWGKYLINNNKFEHSNSSYGENLYQTRSRTKDKSQLVKKALKAWYKEINFYDFDKNEFIPEAGHFTAVVWKATKRVGVAVVTKKVANPRARVRSVVVCSYDPPGNQMGEFAANVIPPNDLLKKFK